VSGSKYASRSIVLRRGGVAQDVFEPPRQQRPVHWFGDEVRGAGLEGQANGFRILVTRHHHDGHAREARHRSQAPAHLIAIHAGHVDVQQKRPPRRSPTRPRTHRCRCRMKGSADRLPRRIRQAERGRAPSSSAMTASGTLVTPVLMPWLADREPARSRAAVHAPPATRGAAHVRGPIAGEHSFSSRPICFA